MNKETVNVKMNDEFKKKAMDLLDDTIKDVLSKKNSKLSANDKRKIRNLSLDQVNINISQRGKSKSMWVFDTETFIPVSVRTEKKLGSASKHSLAHPENRFFRVQNNLTWTYQTTNAKSEESVNRKEFEEIVLQTLLEDFETSAFYGTLSYVED